MKKFLVAAAILLCSSVAHAQLSISPVIVEGSGGKDLRVKAKGAVAVQNVGVRPLPVVIEVHSFMADDSGKILRIPLPSTVSVDLSETSFMLGARQTHTINYTVSCTGTCWGAIDSTAILGKTSNGMAFKIGVPQTFYICEKGIKGSCRSYIRREKLHLEK